MYKLLNSTIFCLEKSESPFCSQSVYLLVPKSFKSSELFKERYFYIRESKKQENPFQVEEIEECTLFGSCFCSSSINIMRMLVCSRKMFSNNKTKKTGPMTWELYPESISSVCITFLCYSKHVEHHDIQERLEEIIEKILENRRTYVTSRRLHYSQVSRRFP